MALGHYNNRFNSKILLTKWIINTISLFIVVKTIKGLDITMTGFDGFITLIVTAAVIGIINTFIKPLLFVLTLPITIFTFGFFILILNGIMFILVSVLVPGFEVSSLWGAIIGSLLYSFISWICNLLIRSEDDDFFSGGSTTIHYRILK